MANGSDNGKLTRERLLANAPLSKGAKRPPREGASPTHKRRSLWFQGNSAWPAREAPVARLVRERARVAAQMEPAPVAAQWESVGPTNIGGRMTSVVCHPDDADRIWAGAAGGGVWHSPDAGRSWQPLWHDQDLNVGSLAIDPHDPNVLYCGTGEANFSVDSYPGVGVYRSIDGGRNWLVLAPADVAGIPSRIGRIAVDPGDPLHLRLGGLGFRGDANPGGLYVSRDGGVSWARETFVSASNDWCHEVVFDPGDPQRIYATFTASGTGSGIWRSTDGGRTWQHLLQGLPDPALFFRTSLALARSRPRTLYALAGDQGDRVLGVFRSDDGGDSWAPVHGDFFHYERRLPGELYEGQMNYGNTIAVHPEDPDHAICGGVDLHLTTDGGRTWELVTEWNRERGDSNYAHADHHALLMPAAAPGRVYDMNDGGMDVSENGGKTWANRSSGLAVTMYYDLDVSQVNPNMFGGGCQDNGTLITLEGNPDDHFMFTGGDGGWMVLDPNDANHLYTSSQSMTIHRFRPSDGWGWNIGPADPEDRRSVWMARIAMDPSDSNVLFVGSFRVWRTTDDGDSWNPVSPSLDTSPISAIEIAPADPRVIYAGTENGGFFRSTDGGDTWGPNLSGPIPGLTLTRIESSPDDAAEIVVTVANFGLRHVWHSTDGGDTWSDIDGGRLPDVPHHAAVIPPGATGTLYVGNDAGVFVSDDRGQSWRNLTRNLPNVPVVDLVHQRAQNTLTAATYGRSLWRIQL